MRFVIDTSSLSSNSCVGPEVFLSEIGLESQSSNFDVSCSPPSPVRSKIGQFQMKYFKILILQRNSFLEILLDKRLSNVFIGGNNSFNVT